MRVTLATALQLLCSLTFRPQRSQEGKGRYLGGTEDRLETLRIKEVKYQKLT